MQAQDIAQLGAWLAATDLELLELRGPWGQVRIQRDGVGTAQVAAAPGTPAGQAGATRAKDMAPVATAPAPGMWRDQVPGRSEPLARPGAAVRAGDLLGLVQAGPLLLPVRAPADGVLGDWLVAPGTAVGYGTALAALHPPGLGPLA